MIFLSVTSPQHSSLGRQDNRKGERAGEKRRGREKEKGREGREEKGGGEGEGVREREISHPPVHSPKCRMAELA